jgi:hypothetical protein
VLDDQVITQAIKALRAGPLHNHLVREWPKIVPELYEQFTKFSKLEVQHFRKLEQQRKVAKLDEAPRPHYSDNQRNYPKPVHSIDSDGYRPPENWKKNFRGPSQERNPRTFDQRCPQYNQRGRASNRGWGHSRGTYTMKPLHYMYHGSKTNHHTKDCPIYLETKKKMEQDLAQPSHQLAPREVNHTMQWAPHHQQYSPSYPLHFPAQTYQNSQTQPLAYYQSYHYATTNHPQPSLVQQIIYTPPVPQITYPTPHNSNPQVKMEINPSPPLPLPQPQTQEPPQQPNTFSTHGTILTITRGSNTKFETKRQHRDYYRQVNHVAVEGPIT